MKHPGRKVNVNADLCLCGSGKLMRDCCLFVRCDTRTPSPITGYSHPSCFASALKDCSPTISREHYVSKSILKLFGEGGLMISGMPWLPEGVQKKVSSASLTGKMLCERHNNALSPLDELTAKFFRFFTSGWNGDTVEVYLIRGFDLERWLLKMLCGLVVSGNATFNGKQLLNWKPPFQWLEILFGNADVVAPAGLHAIVGRYTARQASFTATPVFKTATANPIAIVFGVEGLAFLLSLEELPPMNAPSKTGADIRYRPMALQVNKSNKTLEAHFGWPNGGLVIINISE
jgi:hypothetical protein